MGGNSIHEPPENNLSEMLGRIRTTQSPHIRAGTIDEVASYLGATGQRRRFRHEEQNNVADDDSS